MKLYPFQEETIKQSVDFLRNNESHSVYVANEMGLGKSATALLTIANMKGKLTLIICPAIMRLVWKEEIEKWIGKASVLVLSNSNNFPPKYDLDRAPIFFITSYELVTSCYKQLPMVDFLVCDEAHYLKNRKAKRTKIVLEHFLPRSCYKIYLSGTPMTKNVTDLYPVFSKILPSHKRFGSFYDFAYRYAYTQQTPWGTKYYGLKNYEELSRTIRENFYIRYKKQEVLPQLPSKTYQQIHLDDSYAVKEENPDIRNEISSLLESLGKGEASNPSPALATLRRLQGLAKVHPVAQFAKELLDQEIPIVIFAHHKDVISALAKELDKYNPYVITGDTNQTVRKSSIDDFQAGNSNLIILNFIAGGVGITLTRSSTVLLAEYDWIPATINQAIDRVHRISQTQTVSVYWFPVMNSLDEALERLIIQRTREFNKVMDYEVMSKVTYTLKE